jgi:D-arabinose 1-dehydrogenase-like Zn-dependent alcohol dehydrogenase
VFVRRTTATKESALVAIPAGLSSAAAAPLLCAGLTVYHALLRGTPRPGSTAGILGIGGLGHLGIQYVDKMGLNTIAIARGHEKEKLSRQLGAATTSTPRTAARRGSRDISLTCA